VRAAGPPVAPAEPPTEPVRDPSGALARARAAFKAGRLDEALATGREAADAGAGAAAHLLLGNTLFLLRRFDEAEKEYVETLRLYPSDTVARERLDKIREMRGTGAQ